MKNFIIAVFLTLFTFQLSALDISSTHQGMNNLNRFYVDLIGKTATLNGGWGLFGGMRAGYNINNNISVGLVGHGLIPDKLGGSYINQERMNFISVTAVQKQNININCQRDFI